MRKVSSSFSLRLILLLSIAGALPLFAQNGQIQGTLTDPSGASISGAHVSLKDVNKGIVVKEAETSGDGHFGFQPLPQGNYSISAESSGMKKLERTGITLDVNQILNLGDVQMTLRINQRAGHGGSNQPAGGNLNIAEVVYDYLSAGVRDGAKWPRLSVAPPHSAGRNIERLFRLPACL